MTKNEFTKIVEKLVQMSPSWESVTGIEVVPLYDVMETLHQYVDEEVIKEKPWCPLHDTCAYWDPVKNNCFENCEDHGYFPGYVKK